jgi:hypothetical protein
MATHNIGNKVGFSFFERESDFNAEMRQTLADNIVFLRDTRKIVTHGTEFPGSDSLKQVDLTTYNTAVNGEIVQHVGATTQNYTHGYIYEFTQGSTVTKEYTTLVSLSKVSTGAPQLLRSGVTDTYDNVYDSYFPNGINTKAYRTDLSVPIIYGSHDSTAYTDHIQVGDMIIEDNCPYLIDRIETEGDYTRIVGTNPEMSFDGGVYYRTDTTPTQVSPIYQVGEGKYISEFGYSGLILLDETLAPIALADGYTQYSYDEEYAEWETETITIPPTWTRIDVQPVTDISDLEERVGDLEEKNYIESPTAIQSLEVTDDNIQAGHNPDTTVNNAALLLGNGTSSTPHNALVVDWNGNLTASGNITDGQGNTLADLPTKATLGDVLVDGKVVLWNAATQSLVTATTDQLRNLLMWIGTESELRTLQQNDSLEEGKLYATLDDTYFS